VLTLVSISKLVNELVKEVERDIAVREHPDGHILV
jgi:hypothetical protein